MFNKTIAKRYFAENWLFFMIITIVLSLFMFLIVAVSNRFGSGSGTITMDLTQLIGNSFSNGLGLILPMIFVIVVCNKMFAAKVDKGSLAGILSTPIKRNEITITNLICFVLSLFVMFLFVFIVGIGAGAIFQPGALNIELFTYLILGGFLFQIAISGICFFSSCFFNTSNKSIALGAGIAISFYILNIIQALDSSLEFLKYFTINTLFDVSTILTGSGFIIQFIVLGIIGIAGFTAGIITFNKKDLPL